MSEGEEVRGQGQDQLAQGKSSPDEIEIERLRSLQLRAIQVQQRARVKGATVSSPLARTVSPIKEESPAQAMAALSPTLEGAFSSPPPTGQTSSTASTESAKTIRGSVPPTPAAAAAAAAAASRPLRTPSYPFPTVPNTPMTWATSFHQPFTNLSPTVSALYGRDFATPRERIASETSTPAASGTPFAPGERIMNSPAAEDPRFPSPNLYELVLQLSVEPGLAAWWNTTTTIMHECYGVERATLAVPADASDIENVPWGQKTTFHFSSHEEEHPQIPTVQETKPTPLEKTPEQASSPERCEPVHLPSTPSASPSRPKLPTRHSFAGHERKRDVPSDGPAPPPMRPRGPLRAASHAPHSTPRTEHPLRQVSPVPSFDGTGQQMTASTPFRGPSFSDPDFSSVGGIEAPPAPTSVFPVLRALDHEPDALIDNAGINRVLERGRLVTLTRDYSTSIPASRKGSADHDQTSAKSSNSSQERLPTPKGRTPLPSRPGNFDQAEIRLNPRYEEYEQFPSSPWAQSPAPSPAIQNDPTENPFFSTGNVDEETFNPTNSSQDYTQYGLVEAIGVDRASTVTHIPLIHPTLSQIMQDPDPASPSGLPPMSRTASERSTQGGRPEEPYQRRAPIAILSILSSIVPYPRNLTNSLKHLAPHLATTFSIAWQFSNAQAQAVGVRQRRFTAGQQPGMTSISDPESLDELLHLDLEDISHSAAGSVTSPSDYSSRSRQSPGGSITGTPGWDVSALGLPSRTSVGSTPGYLAGSDAVESYFDAKKKTARGTSQIASLQDQKRKPENRPAMRSVNIAAESPKEDMPTPTPRNEKLATEDRRARISYSYGGHHRGHSLLHSYGADFSSSFQSLPTTTTPGVRTPGTPLTHTRTGSYPESHDVPMPPPSENLLRTIIDSLPVQIFTALPTTGALTWVNAKFLIYRGQESHQVLRGPWDAIHPDDREDYLAQWNKSLKTGQQLQKKVRLRRFDDNYRWFYVRVAPLKNKRQQIVHWIGTNMDFHEQHLAELNSLYQQETAASEAKYRALANSSPQVVFVVSNRRGLTFCNSQWEAFSGQTEAQARVNGFLEHVHPEDVIKCKLPEMNEDGTAAVNVPTSLPTEHARQGSSSSEESSETSELTVTSPAVASPDRLDMPQAKLSKLASTGILRITKNADGRASYSTEVRLRNKDGEYRWHLVRVLLEKSLAEDSEEETWYGTATDINDHKLLEQTLKETMDAKSRFLSNMSHEIRTPLNGISGMVNFLLDSTLNAEQLEQVNIIKSSTDSLLNLINDILDLSKVEAGMIKLTMEWLHLPSLLEEVNDLNMGLAVQKGLELNYLVEEGVPSMVKGDKFRIRQVLLNVVGNAIKFTNKGEIFVRCQLQPPERLGNPNPNETMIRFEVIDTGRGFTDREAKYLFKRFSQIDASSTRQHGGTGLGLAISMQFVELHGGSMDARSVPEKGSTFFFTLKFGLPTDDDFPQPPTAIPGTPISEIAPSAPSLPIQQPQLQRHMLPQALANVRQDRMSSTSSPGSESIKSPVPSITTSERSRESPSLSSGSSDHSLNSNALTGKSSLRSERSSASSFLQEATMPKGGELRLSLPAKGKGNDQDNTSDDSQASLDSEDTARPSESRSLSPLANSLQPPMYSILVVCPLEHSREATIRHIKNTLPSDIPHQITGQPNLVEAQRMIGGDNPVLFTHVVLVLHETFEVIAIMDQILNSMVHGNTAIVVVSDPTQKKELMKEAPAFNYDQLTLDRRLQFIYRPLKPSKFAVIFDPQKERELSTDRNQDTAQQVVFNQKLVFEELKRRLGDKGHKVLLVEDNHINQTVILKFLAKISIETETVLDGVQCTETVFSKPPGYYSIILCDLHMPNKDGYQACKEIRRWEKKNGYRRHPIIALSANVLGDVYAKCVEVGFNSYVTKPVAFKELSLVMTKFLDPVDKTQSPEPMTLRN
ncbi:autoinducer 2 sensor kinase/phosphatase-like protein luxQ [Massarina eburnea CBS 473.64]|uniref:histidine kinase n=1 Tax=Massarina eburnea CBS 473.64 TaxID=1395130 RepID=A0A6A6S189_9PLEO|nr:autoinducer 2 sensor kinase/phosphatase-like protein luxQ [Massarina eburnea CBS 473.64]